MLSRAHEWKKQGSMMHSFYRKSMAAKNIPHEIPWMKHFQSQQKPVGSSRGFGCGVSGDHSQNGNVFFFQAMTLLKLYAATNTWTLSQTGYAKIYIMLNSYNHWWGKTQEGTLRHKWLKRCQYVSGCTWLLNVTWCCALTRRKRAETSITNM